MDTCEKSVTTNQTVKAPPFPFVRQFEPDFYPGNIDQNELS